MRTEQKFHTEDFQGGSQTIRDKNRRTKGDQREAEKCGWVNSHRRHLKVSAVELGWMEHILREVT